MKRLFLFLIIPIFTFGQNPKMKGIDIFEIGKTNLSIIDTLVNEGYENSGEIHGNQMSEIQEKYLYSEKGELYNKHFFYELKGDLSRLYRTAPMIPNYRILVVVNYSFFGKETFEAKEMELHFYEGILFYISFSDMYNSSSEMDKLKKNYNIIDPKLKSDYGFTSTIENKIVECKNNNNKIQTTEKIKYLTDKNIIGKIKFYSKDFLRKFKKVKGETQFMANTIR